MAHNHPKKWLNGKQIAWLLVLVATLALVYPLRTLAATAEQETDSSFNIQVSPSPMLVTLKPGVSQTQTLTVRNISNHSETLTPGLKGFKYDKAGQNIELIDALPADMSSWVHFKPSPLVIKPGEITPLEITYDTPENVGFSYSVVITLSRSNELANKKQGATIKAQVAVFNLVNIDRPGAKRDLTIDSFTTSKGVYEFLPASFTINIRNRGNVIDQPAGSIFIQRGLDDSEPIATIPVNTSYGYVLPDTTRAFESTWQDGFPKYVEATKDGKTTQNLTWNWQQANQLRFGRYVAKIIMIYNDGQRDVPVIANVSFWVIPWRAMAIAAAIIIILLMGLFGWGKMIASGTKRIHWRGKKRR